MLQPLRFAVALTLVALLGACTTTVVNHGHRVVEEDLQRIRPGFSSRGEVLSLLGSPSVEPSFDPDTWYYISRRIEETTFYNRTLAAQEVVRVHFDDVGTVSEVERYDLADGHDVVPIDDKTPTGGNEQTLAQQLFGNIGRFNAPTGDSPVGF